MNDIISLYESYLLNGREVSAILMQGVFSDERLQKVIKRAKDATGKAISDGNYTYVQNVYVHPVQAKKPYLEKYKIA